jgi:alcohol dehydrogenase class IV
VSELEQLNRDLNVPSPVDFGIMPDKFIDMSGTMAEQALSSGSPANNPRVPTKTQIIDIYKKII